MNLLKNIFSIYSDAKHYIICILGLKIKIRSTKKEIEFLQKQINHLKIINLQRDMKLLPVNSIKKLEIHIIDHCNLNCKGCHHFAPLAPESFRDLSEFKNDLTRMFELTGGEVETFNILGGEPLLHPQCIEFLETARNIFPKSEIKLVTNGILLPKQSDNFYKRCGKSNILIRPTYYGLDIDWDTVKKKCRQFGIDFQFYLYNETFYKDAIDLSGSRNPLVSYLNCQLGWHQLFYLDHGKIYHCSREAYMRFFSDYFKLNIEIPKTDYIDIYKAKNIQEIYNFMNTPPKFCSHCINNETLSEYKRVTSKKEITEWIDE